MNGVLSPRSMRALRDRFTAPAEQIADRLVEQGISDAVTDLAEVYPLRVFPMRWGWGRRDGSTCCPRRPGLQRLRPDNELRRNALAAAAPVQAWIMA